MNFLNLVSDVWSGHALTLIREYFERSVYDQEDVEARSKMHLASAFAGKTEGFSFLTTTQRCWTA